MDALEERQQIIQDCFRNFRNDGKLTKIICEDNKNIYLSESILRIFSRYINSLFESTCEKETVVILPDVKLSNIQQVKDLLLCGHSNLKIVEDQYEVQHIFDTLLGFNGEDFSLNLEINNPPPIKVEFVKSEPKEYHECLSLDLNNAQAQMKVEVHEAQEIENIPVDFPKNDQDCDFELPEEKKLLDDNVASEDNELEDPINPIKDLSHDCRTPSPFQSLRSTPPKQEKWHRGHKGKGSGKYISQNGGGINNQAPISKLPELQYIYKKKYHKECGRRHSRLDICEVTPAHAACGRKHGYANDCDGTWMSLPRFEALALKWPSTLAYKSKLEKMNNKRIKVSRSFERGGLSEKLFSTCWNWNQSECEDEGCHLVHRCSYVHIDDQHGDRVCWGWHKEVDHGNHGKEKNRRAENLKRCF